uniref:Glutaredoxin domain-containing protein n=1 Tax=Panagrellus redivivus TaxID=6233 RepID=A0A7E4ZXV1_PANRE
MVDFKRIESDLLRIKLEIERALDENNDYALIQRNGSVRGRKFHVFNTMRKMQLRSQWKKNYIAEESAKVVIYTTSCGIVRKTYERCRDTVALLRAHGIIAELRDLNMNNELVDEIINRMGLHADERDFVLMSLPLVYVDGNYFGNHSTLIECNDAGELAKRLNDFKGRQKCTTCGDLGYTLCSSCRGSKKSQRIFQNTNLRCAFCDENGIVPCKSCLRK